MACQNIVLMLSLASLLLRYSFSVAPVTEQECSTVTALVSACSSFVSNGTPDPIPGSACCVAMTSLNTISESTENKRTVCRCLMELISTYNPNATAIATLPGFCGVSLGFTLDPNTDCEYIT